MEYSHEQAVADGSTSTSTSTGSAPQITRAGLDDRGRHSSPSSATARPAQTRWEQLDEDLDYTARPARPRRRRRGPDPHRARDLPRPALHRDLPRPHRGAEDADLRQGRRPRRRHRHRSSARCSARATTSPPRSPTRRPARTPTSCSPAFRNSLQPADRRHRRHDRHRHRREAARVRVLHARRSRAAPTSSR